MYLIVEANPGVSVLLLSSQSGGHRLAVPAFHHSLVFVQLWKDSVTVLHPAALILSALCHSVHKKKCYIIPLTHNEALPVVPAASFSPQTRKQLMEETCCIFWSTNFSQLMPTAIFVCIQLISYLVTPSCLSPHQRILIYLQGVSAGFPLFLHSFLPSNPHFRLLCFNYFDQQLIADLTQFEAFYSWFYKPLR